METASQDSIDLQELAVRIIRYFRNHLKLIVAFCVLGMIGGGVAFVTLPTVYQSQMVVLSDLLTKPYGDRMDKSLNNLIKENNVDELSAKLNLSKENAQALQLVDIECEPDTKSPQRDKLEKDETFFIITVDLTDRLALPAVQEGLLYYLRSNEWVKARTLQREQTSLAVVQTIDKQIRQLDSLKRTLFQKGQPRTDNIQFDPSMVFTATVDLTRLRWKAQQELELANSIHLVEGFTVFQKPKDPKLSTLLILGFMLGLFSSVGLLTIKHLVKLARN